MLKSDFLRPGLIAMAFFVAHSATGVSIREREEDVAKRSAEKKKSKSRTSEDIATSAFGSGTYPSSGGGESFLGGFWGWLVAAPFQYRHDDPSGSLLQDGGDEERADGRRFIFPRHELGQATVPYVRFDYNWQSADWDVADTRLELGYKLFAFHGRMTRYSDSEGDELDVSQYYGVLRYGGYRPNFLPGTFEFSIGLGVAQHAAVVGDDSSGAITVPLKYHPVDWFGIEFRPAWYRWDEITIGDYDLSVSLGARFVQLRGGYRWIWDNGVVDEQSGPYAGVSVSF
ncbi:MAG: hypothetical protein KAH99_03410 [Verrucomicrobia bacterium]|nr:hypothetical protein [Verrucomicrobiota bacterium]